ncbi:glycoside hydrolase N-terminal domain-containing protein [Paenibacillus sp. GP183]|uniref:glycosyl hydrolase family 95 catalytic domain-containing protein n=1 Tax=Paenibacillus sp. GP183 TaxID=1882751 RepID=UPI00089B729A|nr:glycoside hydrolase N-terminal domain-containing protein [Paenibacillus sp. GP183]SED07822.1 Glycosyl hydrolase family 65, N-terminal domain [Paenibacillus sp. GP183]
MNVRSQLESISRAKQHPITLDRPAPDFFEGAVLGNGGLGAIVTTRPDAVVIHFGHNNVWDIRIAEENREKLGTFQEIFAKIMEISPEHDHLHENEWYRDYCRMARENYAKPYPCPMPCGSLLLGFDRREAEILGHKIDISTGICEVYFLIEGKQAVLEIFVEPQTDQVWLRMVDGQGEWITSPFNRIKLIPDPERSQDLPRFVAAVAEEKQLIMFEQTLPYREDFRQRTEPHPQDRAFRLSVRTADAFRMVENPLHYETYGIKGDFSGADSREQVLTGADLLQNKPFLAVVQLEEGLLSDLLPKPTSPPVPELAQYEQAREESIRHYDEFWGRSAVELEDELLEKIWYWNLYFFQCAVKAGVTCPGLFANWSYRKIGTSWHGDYHFNYNAQQPFWAAFSSNHVDRHVAYVDLVHHILPISRSWANDYYGLRGACFPHSAYPVDMTMMPYPIPTWGWEICETPWTVQSLWWHYLYTMDRDFLKHRAFVPIKESVRFLADYMTRPEAHGDSQGDGKCHIFPTVVPELYGLTPFFKMNKDCLVDLTLAKFVFKAYLSACRILGFELEEKETIEAVEYILRHYPDYPTANSEKYGEVLVCVEGEDPQIVYNTPNSLMTVFPGEEHGIHSVEERELLRNTYMNHLNEGGNELVFYSLQGARLGLLDLQKFKRQIHYCMLPNGTCTDKLLQSGGRYHDATDFNFMGRMGIWFENFALPAVINECLMQSYNGQIRLFPNWPKGQKASFSNLRAVGGFLISAAYDGENVEWVELFSEAGGRLRMHPLWSRSTVSLNDRKPEPVTGPMIEWETRKGDVLRFSKG